MAGSRLEKIGTIYTRTTGLLRSGALNWEDRPLWYDIYEAFPPQDEPRFDRPVPNMKLKQILYAEDKIRALFHKNNRQIGAANLHNNNYKSLTQRFIENYKIYETEYKEGGTQCEIYTKAIEALKREKEVNRGASEEGESVNLSTAYKEAKSNQMKNQDNPKINMNVTNIFKD